MSDKIENFRYETWEIDEMVRAIERPNPFLLRMFFPNVREENAKVIEFDIVEGGRRLAPFVSPLVQGQPVRSRGYKTQTLTPAYIKPSAIIHPNQGWTRRPGEPYGGNLTPRERLDRVLAEQIAEHDEMIDNRLEWMAAQALINGSITVSGESYPTVVVEFGRNSNLYKELESSVQWHKSEADPLADIEMMALDIRQYSYGAVADTVVMDGKAWDLMRTRISSNAQLRVQFDNTLRLGSSSAEIGPRNDIDGEYVGRLAGRFDLWVYDGTYEDEEGVGQKYLPDYHVIVGSRAGVQGTQYFGAIQDLDAGLVPMRHFVKTKVKFDPSGLEVLSQSAPLVAPKRPNAVGCMVVKTESGGQGSE